MDETIALPALRRAAELAPGSADEAARTVEVVWSTGARVRRTPLFAEAYDEELSMEPHAVRLERLNAGAPLLAVHDAYSLGGVIGSVVPRSARIEAGRGLATVRLSERAEVEPIWRDILAGHLRAVSVGYQVHRYEVSKDEGGHELWRAVDWTPFEISAVPIGADPAAAFRADEATHACVVVRDGAHSKHRSTTMHEDARRDEVPAEGAPSTPTTRDGTEEDRQDGAAAETRETRDQPAAPPAPPTMTPAATPAQPDDPAVLVERALERERERVAGIDALAERFRLERAFAQDLVRRGVSLDEARRRVLDHLAASDDAVATFPHVATPLGGADETATRAEAVTSALLHRYDPTAFALAEPAREYRGMTLLDLARDWLEAHGERVRGLSRDELARRALEVRAGFHTTSDFPSVLAAVANKALRQAYEAAPRTFTPFSRQVFASDFKDMHRVQLSGMSPLKKVNEHGEFTAEIGRASCRERV